MNDALFESHLPLPLAGRGKVRDIYQIDEKHLLIVTTDRLSAFDVVFPDPIPGKGEILTQMSNFWFAFFAQTIPNHLTALSLTDILNKGDVIAMQKRAVIVKKMRALPVEAVVRGYLVGSGWKDYRQHGSVCGIPLPRGLELAQKLPQPIFTPSTKAEIGAHDENIRFEQMADTLGADLAEEVRDRSLELYEQAAHYALRRGIIIADTKLEFGLDENDRLVLIDEAFTPDSSRFWPANTYKPGQNPDSYDKQYVRDYVESIHWDKKPPAPKLPQEVIAFTAEKYREALNRLTTT